VLATHVAFGDYSLNDGVSTTSGTGAGSTLKIDFSKGAAGEVAVEGSDAPPATVVKELGTSCNGPVYVISSVLVPKNVADTSAFAAASAAAVSPAPAPGTCTPAVPAIKKAGGDGITTAVELAAVRACIRLADRCLAAYR
jgi:Fasciclin domain